MQLRDGALATCGVHVVAMKGSRNGNYSAGHTGVITKLNPGDPCVRWDHSGATHQSTRAKLQINYMRLRDGTLATCGIHVVAMEGSRNGHYSTGHTGVITKLNAGDPCVRWDHNGATYQTTRGKLQVNGMPKSSKKKATIKLTGARWYPVETIPADEETSITITSSSSYTASSESKSSSSNESSHEWSVDVEQNWTIFGQKGGIKGHYGGGVKSGTLNSNLNAMVNSSEHTKTKTKTCKAHSKNRQLFQLRLEGVDDDGTQHWWMSVAHRYIVPFGEDPPHVSTVLKYLI